jgi:hypothetical protein
LANLRTFGVSLAECLFRQETILDRMGTESLMSSDRLMSPPLAGRLGEVVRRRRLGGIRGVGGLLCEGLFKFLNPLFQVFHRSAQLKKNLYGGFLSGSVYRNRLFSRHERHQYHNWMQNQAKIAPQSRSDA